MMLFVLFLCAEETAADVIDSRIGFAYDVNVICVQHLWKWCRGRTPFSYLLHNRIHSQFTYEWRQLLFIQPERKEQLTNISTKANHSVYLLFKNSCCIKIFFFHDCCFLLFNVRETLTEYYRICFALLLDCRVFY